jgi:hypothetical protein
MLTFAKSGPRGAQARPIEMYTKHLCCMLAGAPCPPPRESYILYFETQTSEQQEPSNNWPALAGRRPARPGDRSAVPGRAHRSTQLV